MHILIEKIRTRKPQVCAREEFVKVEMDRKVAVHVCLARCQREDKEPRGRQADQWLVVAISLASRLTTNCLHGPSVYPDEIR